MRACVRGEGTRTVTQSLWYKVWASKKTGAPNEVAVLGHTFVLNWNCRPDNSKGLIALEG